MSEAAATVKDFVVALVLLAIVPVRRGEAICRDARGVRDEIMTEPNDNRDDTTPPNQPECNCPRCRIERMFPGDESPVICSSGAPVDGNARE